MNNKKAAFIICACAALAAALLASARLHALGSGPSSDWSPEEKVAARGGGMSLYDKGVAAHKAGDYRTAEKLFRKALKKDKKNPDILNMLAHTELKLGMMNEAIDDYWKALAIRPRFPEAREYMGEAYIQATLKEIDTLGSYGAEGAEARADLVKAFRKAAESLPPGK